MDKNERKARNMARHTPEPWRVVGEDIVSDAHAYAGLIAAVYGGGLPPDDDRDAEVEANRCLLLAAPNMLKALEEIALPRKFRQNPESMKAIARVAVAKAKGGK